ncbi:MAG: class I SAM-dependent methyltransferase [Defluviitaleaceae bacterium]|nr:class I SAM-dependent methyltransferase [Defluviitaleaceae bacterium]MCL2239679.1 class I SAM-dependent methyltransferase [Defluviitaleaceae bacterium]
MANGTGWARGRRVHFDEIVEGYDRARGGYPSELYADIFNYNQGGKKAIEIGAGTGLATIPFLNNGYNVTAIEMGANMVDFLMQKFSGNQNFSVINDTFENASVDGEAYDIIYAASAFHWVDAEMGCPKVLRLLKDGGTFALFRNNTVPADGEVLYEEIQSAYEKHYNSYYTSSKRPIKKTVEDFWKPSEIYTSFRFESMEQYGFRDVTMKFYNASRTYSADEYIALMDTMSDNRALPENNRTNLYADIKNAIERHGGQHTVDYMYQLYMGRK